jgi:hypothetical protein
MRNSGSISAPRERSAPDGAAHAHGLRLGHRSHRHSPPSQPAEGVPGESRRLSIVKRSVTRPQAGEAVLELQLSGKPDLDWENAFDHYPARHVQGATLRFNNSRPAVHDDFITWNIPERDVENGTQFVIGATDFANEYLVPSAR